MNSTIKPKACKTCGSLFHTPMYHKPRSPPRATKPLPRPKRRIKQIGKRTLQYNEWRDQVARPYLIATYGEVCIVPGCTITTGLDVDHIENRGSHPELKMTLSNVQLMCRPHHSAKTDRLTI
jgi:5-methylcytosine-specific restriction endonuclease McrA